MAKILANELIKILANELLCCHYYIDMNWSGNFREGLAREIRENKTLAKITAYTVINIHLCKQ